MKRTTKRIGDIFPKIIALIILGVMVFGIISNCKASEMTFTEAYALVIGNRTPVITHFQKQKTQTQTQTQTQLVKKIKKETKIVLPMNIGANIVPIQKDDSIKLLHALYSLYVREKRIGDLIYRVKKRATQEFVVTKQSDSTIFTVKQSRFYDNFRIIIKSNNSHVYCLGKLDGIKTSQSALDEMFSQRLYTGQKKHELLSGTQ